MWARLRWAWDQARTTILVGVLCFMIGMLAVQPDAAPEPTPATSITHHDVAVLAHALHRYADALHLVVIPPAAPPEVTTATSILGA